MAQAIPVTRAAFGIADVEGDVARVLADGTVETLAVAGADLTGLQSVAWRGDGSALVLAGGSVFQVEEGDVSKWADCAGCSGIASVDGGAVSLRVKDPGLELVRIDAGSGAVTAVAVDFVQPIEPKALAASGITPRLVGVDARERALLTYPAALADTAGGPTVVALHELDGELVDWGQTDGEVSSAMLSARGDQVAVLGELWPGTCDSADLLRIMTIDESGFFGRIPEFEVSINDSHVKYENARWEGDDLVATVVSHPMQMEGTCQPAKKREEFRAGVGGEMTLTVATASEWYRLGSVGASCEAEVERAPKDGTYRIDGTALAVDRIFLPGEESCSEPATVVGS